MESKVFETWDTPVPGVTDVAAPVGIPGVKEAEERIKGVSTGTTIMAVEFDGGVILGADCRTSTGRYIANRASDKITQIHDRIYTCRSGSAADTQAVSDYVRRFAEEYSIDKGSPATVKTVAHLFKTICYNNKDRLMAGLIIAGVDDVNGPQVYTIPLGAPLIRQKVATGGSGSIFITGFCDSYYREGMSKDECKEFVVKAISHAIARDGSSGGSVRLVTITKDSVTREFVAGDKLPYKLP